MTHSKAILLATAALALLAASGRADAALVSARDLAAACAGDAAAKAMCNGYLMAVTDGVLQRESRGGNRKMCVPDNVTVDQVRDSVTHYGGKAADAPTGIRLVIAAMRATWPCAGDAANAGGNGGGNNGGNGRRHGRRDRGDQNQ